MRVVFVCVALCLVPLYGGFASEIPPADPTPVSSVGAGPVDDYAAIPQRDKLMPPEFSREEVCDAVMTAAQANDLPVSFFARLIWQESAFKPTAVSRAGAQGIAQFMPETAASVGLADPFDPTQAIPASARHLRDLHQEFGNAGLAAAAYNAGSRRVRDWLKRRSGLPRETRLYVLSITGRHPEAWIGTKLKPANLVIPAGTQCNQAAAVAAVTAVSHAARFVPNPQRPRVIRTRLEPATPPPPIEILDFRHDIN